MKIAVIGTGNIGGTLGRALAAAGHDVTFGSRDPGDDSAAGGPTARVADVAGALAGAEVVLIAVPGGAVDQLVRDHADALAATLVVDCANNMSAPAAHSHDAIAAAVPTVRYARAFNTLGFENLQNPRFGDARADMFFSCEEADRATLEQLIEAVGLRPVYVGADAQDVVDGALRLWFALARQRGRHLAFRVLDDHG